MVIIMLTPQGCEYKVNSSAKCFEQYLAHWKLCVLPALTLTTRSSQGLWLKRSLTGTHLGTRHEETTEHRVYKEQVITVENTASKLKRLWS